MDNVERHELAPGYSIARIINGCWQLTPDHGGGPGSDNRTLEIFSDLVDHGFTTFDCADIYIGVEQLLGRFRRSLPDPDSIQIHTKYAANRETLHLLTDRDVDSAVDRSLRRLGVERLDLLQFHWWNYEVDGQQRMVDRLLRAQQDEKIRLLGVTNYDTPHIRAMVEQGVPLVSLQAQYSLLDRRPERAMTALAQDQGMVLLPYGVLAGGFMSERYLDQPSPEAMNRSLQKYRLIIDEIGGWTQYQSLLKVLSRLARRHDTSIAAVAARWVLDRDTVGAVILGTGSRSRAEQNLDVFRLRLDAEDHQLIQDQLDRQNIPPGDMYDLERDMNGIHSSIIKMNLHDTADNR